MKKKYKNQFEADVAKQIGKRKLKFKYEAEKIPYVLAGHYVPDFIIETEHGKIYVECKGYLRKEAKAKMVAVKRQHPNLDIRILFYEKRKSQIRWAERNSFLWAVEKIPNEWFKGGL